MKELQLLLSIIFSLFVQALLLLPKAVIKIIKIVKSILNIIQGTLESLVEITKNELIKQ